MTLSPESPGALLLRLADEMDGSEWGLTNWCLRIRAIASSLEGQADSDRMDWLERQHVEARTPLVYGSRANFHASPGPEDDDETSDLRAKVDAARATQQESES